MKARQRENESRLKDEETLGALEEVAERISVRIHYEEMKEDGFLVQDGYCRVKGESHIYIDRNRSIKEKIHVLANELKSFNLDDIYLPPFLRERILQGAHQTETS
jgi:hypothetical protein